MTSYKCSGVDIEKANNFVEYLKTLNAEIGGFGGLYPIGDQYLVASTDGVGTKLKIACDLNRHHTIGIDLVAMCVNDVITTGAKPLFFLDYYATGHLNLNQAKAVVSGIQQGCDLAGCVLLGGETAEMPGCYPDNFYDLSGFAVGVVDKERLIDGKTICVGDVIVGCSSNGIHSNGYSLIRKVLMDNQISLDEKIDNSSLTLGDYLMIPTRIYTSLVDVLIEHYDLKGIAHITGGGLVDNLARILPRELGVRLRKQSWPAHPLFHWIQTTGRIPDFEMERTFNLGIGMAFVTSVKDALSICNENTDCWVIGTVVQEEGVSFS